MKTETLKNISKAPLVTFAKSRVKRKQHKFNLNLGAYKNADYEKIIPILAGFEKEILQKPANLHGMRWIHKEESVLFRSEETFDIEFEKFIEKVDITRSAEFFKDSMSASHLVVSKDNLNRPTRMGIRFVALPQPNYASFFGKGNLDVYKLVKVDYKAEEHRFSMLTVHSPNSSANCDDGFLSFKSSHNGLKTKVTFLSCQQFPVPPLMALAQADKWSWLKDKLTEDSYKKFSNSMMSNILNCYNGEDFRVGRV